MTSNNTLSWLQKIIVPCMLFIIFAISYSIYSKNMPISYYDELLWVGQSYFFEFFIHGDFNNPAWKSYQSYEQTKLTEYIYGAWLYPRYLIEKNNETLPFDYVRFLIKNGLYVIDENYLDTYIKDKNASHLIKFDEEMSGFPEQWVNRYGKNILKTLDLIYYAKLLNIFLLAGAVVIAYQLVLHYTRLIFAVIFSIFYGFNSLIINMSLQAHSEALFLLTFNIAFFLMILYFNKWKISYLLLFGLFSGLCMSTKINGLMLLIIFFVINIVLFLIKKGRKGYFLLCFTPICISLLIFVLLNPFTYSNPVINTQIMFRFRMDTALGQAEKYPEAYLPDKTTRIKRIFENFYFTERLSDFSSTKIFTQLSSVKEYGVFLFVLFSIGLFYSIKQIFQKNIMAIVFLISFIMILLLMSYYLILDWNRYYILLPLFLILFQLLGLCVVLRLLIKNAKAVLKHSLQLQ